MKFSKSWLQELIKLDIDTSTLVNQLTMIGLEVAATTKAAPNFQGVVVGEILEVHPHPNADKLTICRVNVGAKDQELTIVCGAANVRPKLKVPVALIDAELPGNFKIKKAKLRGIESSGMLCAATELGLPETKPGILELPDEAPLGVDLRQYLALDDEIIEVELTANRGDCLSMFGIAREVAAINQFKFVPQEPPKFHPNADIFPVMIKAKDACPHYCGRIIRGVNNQISTPLWLQERLSKLGINSINLVVDVTNYIMLEMGQPLHAFDLAKLNKKIEVRYAKYGEQLELLNGSTVTLTEKNLVIADDAKPIALAGIMGGAATGVSLTTQDIFLESAFFVPEKLIVEARSLNLTTDALYRFERGVDYKLQLHALDRATALIIEIAGGVPGAVSEVISNAHLPHPPDIILHRQNVTNILGIVIADNEIANILLHLGMLVKPITPGWQVTVPSWRVFDIKIEEDLIEEIARIHGYHLIPEQPIVAELGGNQAISHKKAGDRLNALMENLGYHEIITYSFIDQKLQALVGGAEQALSLANPLSSEQTVMRTTLWPGLISTVQYNVRRKQQHLRLFETGLRFIQQEDKLQQIPAIAGITYGEFYPEQWGHQQREQANFFNLKNDVNAIVKLFAVENEIEYISKPHDLLHPKRSAQICLRGVPVGFIGEIHPVANQQLELEKKLCLFEIDLSHIIKEIHKRFKNFSILPKIQRDISIIVDKEIPWSQIKQKIVDNSGELLHNVVLFDVYCNKNIGLDKRSMAIHLIFQSANRTLVDAEVEVLVDRVILVLKQTFGASLRG